MTYRQLDPSEYPRLINHPALHGWMPDPSTSIVAIAEDGDQIVSLWVAQNIIQLEGFWIHPDYRKRTLLPIRIIAKMRALLDACRVNKAFCWADRPEIEDYLSRLGMTRLPVSTFVFETSPCP